MRSAALTGAAALAVIALLACGRSDRRPARHDGGAPSPAPALPPVRKHDTQTQRLTARAVVAVDQSASMAGFAAQAAIEPALRATGETVKELGLGADQVAFFSVGTGVEPATERALLAPAAFRKARADLTAALDDARLGSDLSVLITDGQPSSAQVMRSACTPLGTEDVSGLARKLSAMLQAGRGVWLVLERAPFRGVIFLNCSVATATIRAALAGRGLACGPECTYRYDGERTLLTIVQAAPETVDDGARYVEMYLRRRPSAAAIRLHPTTAELWVPRLPAVELLGERGVAPIAVSGDATGWAATVTCPTRAAGVRVCVASDEPVPGRARALITRRAPTTALHPDRPDDLHRLPAGHGFDPSLLPKLEAWQHDTCGPVWSLYTDRVSERETPPAPGCPAGASEVVSACGCLPGQAHEERVELVQESTVASELADWTIEAGFGAREATWYQEPDRLNGLPALVRTIAGFWSSAPEEPAAVVGRLRLTIVPAR